MGLFWSVKIDTLDPIIFCKLKWEPDIDVKRYLSAPNSPILCSSGLIIEEILVIFVSMLGMLGPTLKRNDG